MAKKKVPKKAKRRLVFFGPVAVAIIIYSIFTFVTMGSEYYELKTEEKKLTNELSDLKSNASDLKTEITKLQDKDYVARYARENYLYTKNGEYVIKTDTKEKKKVKKKVNKNEDYIMYACIAGAILIILFIIKKHRKSKKKKKVR